MGSSGGGVWLPGDPPSATAAFQALWTAANITATGATGTTATILPATTPMMVTVTGASGAGIQLQTAACVPGRLYLIKNMMTGGVELYAVGATINGTTGTTAYEITATGNLTAIAYCTVAGAWQVGLNT